MLRTHTLAPRGARPGAGLHGLLLVQLAVLALAVLVACDSPPVAAPQAAPRDATAAEPAHAAAPHPRAPRLGLWVLAEGSHRTLEAPERVERLIREAGALRATDLFVQVYRGGRSWFPSQQADAAPYRAILANTGQDTLRSLIAQAHAAGLKVHAWFNVLSLADNADAPLLRALGRRAVLVDRRRRSLLDYPGGEVPEPDRGALRMGTPGVWLDPAAPGVADYLVATLDELVAAYPELDGLHLDFIRHPMALPIVPGSRFDVGLDFGYGEEARAAFEAASGRPFEPGDAWDGFRRDAVTDVVRRLRSRLPATWEHSAAVIAYADRAYLSAMQDWRRWLEEGLLDFGVAMAYTRDDRMLRYLAGSLTGGVAGERVWLGLGTWLFARDPAGAVHQRAIARAAHPSGVVLFSYDGLVDAPDTLAALRSDAP